MSWIVVVVLLLQFIFISLFFAFAFDGVKVEDVEKAQKQEDTKSHGRDIWNLSLIPWVEYFFFTLKSPIKFPSFYQQVANTNKAGADHRKQGRKEIGGYFLFAGANKVFFSFFFGPCSFFQLVVWCCWPCG